MFTILVILAILLQVVIALGVYFRSRGKHSNILFVLLVLALAAWAGTNYIAIRIPQGPDTIYAIRAVLGLVVVQNTLFYFFARTFPDIQLSKLPRYNLYLCLYSLLVLVVTQTPLIFASAVVKDGFANPVVGHGMPLFILHALYTTGFGLSHLFRKHRRSNGREKTQLLVILFATFIVLLVVPITNFVITLVAQTTIFVRVGPFYTLGFGALIAYAIISQKLFDIRAAVARALAYVLSLGTLVAAYGSIIFLISERFFKTANDVTVERLFYIGFAIVSSLFYGPIKHFFDKVTNRIFFQDAYEPQVFLDELNEVLVVNIELEKLLTETIAVIEKNLKARFSVFSIRETSYFPRRIIGDTHKRFDHDDIEEIGNDSAHLHEKVIVGDYLEENNKELKKTLDENDVSVLVRLVATLDYEVQGIGYILFGAKKSGNAYNKQDIQTLEIIANELVIAIQNGLRFEEIEKFNATLQEKIDDATKQLRKTNDKLKAMDETKDEFISMASHQLRTPLTSVKGYLSMVLEGDAGDVTEMQKKLLDQAFVSSQRMVYLIADLLNVSRLRTGKFVIEPIATNLADVVEGEVGQLKETAASRGLTLTYNKPEHFPTLMLDETKIRQVIMNFMDNAIYYTPAGGHISVELKETDNTVEYTVTDDGIGVPKTEQHHLFTKFYRAGNAKKARPDGTGLGLFMAKKVIVVQGGTLIFKSQEGKGSTFGFSFNKAKLQPDQTTDTPPQA